MKGLSFLYKPLVGSLDGVSEWLPFCFVSLGHHLDGLPEGQPLGAVSLGLESGHTGRRPLDGRALEAGLVVGGHVELHVTPVTGHVVWPDRYEDGRQGRRDTP